MSELASRAAGRVVSRPQGALRPAHRRGRLATGIGVLGELMITAGVVVLLFVVYELWITGIFTARDQQALSSQLTRRWEAPHHIVSAGAGPVVSPVPAGQALAVLRIPVLGARWRWVVDEGVAPADLAKGPGHYPGTALPGGVGNFVVSGHRTTHGAPFYNADRLHPGDAIVVETRDAWFVYRVTGESVVPPTDLAVILPVPNRPGATPTDRLLTFTTCNPRFSASQRLIVHGTLATVQLKSQGTPAALTTGKA